MRLPACAVLLGVLQISCDGPAVEGSDGDDLGEAAAAASKAPMKIRSVRTIDGHTQVRMGSTVEIVIRGNRLQTVTSVTIHSDSYSPGTAVVLSARNSEVRARVEIVHGAFSGPYSVSVAGAGGSATLVDGIEVTPYVAAPGGPAGGLGTFQAPLSLCDGQVEGTTTRDQIVLLEGEHLCDDIIDLGGGGQSVVGAGPGATIIRGSSGSFGGFVAGADTTLEGFTIIAPQPAAGAAIFRRGPALRVVRVDLVGAGIRVEDDQINPINWADVQELTFAGAGNGIETVGVVFLDVRNSRFTGCATGIDHDRGRLNFFDSTVEGCDTGVHVRSVPETPLAGIGAQLAGLTLIHNRIGMLLDEGVFVVVSVEITDDEATPVGERGIVLHTGKLTLAFTNIRGQAIAGLDFDLVDGDGSRLELDVGNVTIEGGQYGVRAQGPPRPGYLAIFDSVISDQTTAAVSFAIDGFFILSLDGFSNHLSVLSGFALEDLRQAAHPENPILARTTLGFPVEPLTLNGRTYTDLGLVTGPVSVPPDFRILHESGSIQF